MKLFSLPTKIKKGSGKPPHHKALRLSAYKVQYPFRLCTLIEGKRQHRWQSDSHQQRQSINSPELRLNGKDPRQTADSDTVRHHTCTATDGRRDSTTNHGAEHWELVFQVDAVHRRLCHPEVSRNRSWN